MTAYARNISEVRYQNVSGLLRYGTYLDGAWSVAGNFTASERLYPRRIDDAPPMTTIDGFSNPAEREFVCEEAGSVHIIYHAEIRWRMVLTVQALTDAVENREELQFKEVDQVVHLFVSEYFECLPPPTPTPTATPPPTPMATATPRPPEGFIDVEVLHFAGERFPLEQFHLDEPDSCTLEHYHADFEVHSLEGGVALDPDRGGCGFGTVARITITTDRITDAVWADYRDRFAGVDD